MSPEWLGALASIATLFLVAASAIAALLQMRHMRNANQIVALTEIRETIESPVFHAALIYVLRELPKLCEDPEMRRKMLGVPLPQEFEQARSVATFFESLGVFVKNGAIGRAITFDMWGDAIRNSWDRLAPWIVNRRHISRNIALFENFEYLAVLCHEFKKSHPEGTYPSRVPRMPAVALWPEAE